MYFVLIGMILIMITTRLVELELTTRQNTVSFSVSKGR